MSSEIKHVSEATLTYLRSNIRSNLDRYKGSGFSEHSDEHLWDIGLNIDYDNDKLASLDFTQQKNIVEIDRRNSLIVGEALKNLTPTLANEELIWVRLSHLEAFDYSKSRWLVDGAKDDALVSTIEKHFFAPTQTAIRDDHAVSRLWWNYHIAELSMPNDVERALGLILKTADIRSNFVERIWMSSRQRIAGAILRALEGIPEVTENEDQFRLFMKEVNRQGGGIVFEALDDAEADDFVLQCCERVLASS